MAMGWLKGLVAPAAFPEGNPQGGPPMGGPPMGGPPMGGMPQGGMPQGGQSPYGVQPGMPPGMPAMMQPGMAAPAGPVPYDSSALNNPMQWSTGTRTQGGGSPGGVVGSPAAMTGISGAPAGSLEARCAQLQHDVDSLALFARTLLTILEDNKLVTREQFDATKQRLDMLDGKLDDR